MHTCHVVDVGIVEGQLISKVSAVSGREEEQNMLYECLHGRWPKWLVTPCRVRDPHVVNVSPFLELEYSTLQLVSVPHKAMSSMMANVPMSLLDGH